MSLQIELVTFFMKDGSQKLLLKIVVHSS